VVVYIGFARKVQLLEYDVKSMFTRAVNYDSCGYLSGMPDIKVLNNSRRVAALVFLGRLNLKRFCSLIFVARL